MRVIENEHRLRQVEPASPCPLPQSSADRLSVTFATMNNYSPVKIDNHQPSSDENSEKAIVSVQIQPTIIEANNLADDDDYSASINAIVQRRNSSRRHSRRRRRPSSSFNPDIDGNIRRRSSAFTTSSADTTISMEDAEEQIFEKLKIHKEILYGVRHQPWSLKRKLKLVRQAKSYVRKHEGVLQERLAQSRNTRDVIARASILINNKWQYFKRELVNLQTWLVPWELRIKEIESHFGSAVASYFTFLRWLFWINLVISATLTAFVAIPEVLTANVAHAGERKIMLPEEKIKAKHLLTLWEFEGVLKYSPFFYGWYTNKETNRIYKLPLAYFIANLVVYTYSFVAILRKMAKNSRMSKLSEKKDECAFSWKLFTGWDFMIGNPETAHNRVASIILGFKEALLEEAEKEKDKRNWKITLIRIFVNLLVIFLLALSAYAVVEVVGRSTKIESNSNWWRQNEITIALSLITYIYPLFFEILGIFEHYHPRKQLRLQLARIMVLNLLNLYSLIFALFDKMSHMEVQLRDLRPRLQKAIPSLVCKNVPTSCDSDLSNVLKTLASFSLVLMPNLTVTFTQDTTTTSTTSTTTATTTRIPNTTPTSDMFLIHNIQQSTSETLITHYDDDEPHMDYDYYDSVNLNISSDNFDWDTYNFTFTKTKNNTLYEKLNKTTEREKDINVLGLEDDKKKVVKCYERVCQRTTSIPDFDKLVNDETSRPLDINTRRKLRKLCWETMFGQELAKLTVMDLVLTIILTLCMDFFRALIVRFLNNCWCWDLEKLFPQYGDFKIAENILHLVNNQGMVWMGMFFSPGLTALNLIKLGILMYLRSWAVLTCNVPHEVVFRASRSNNFYLALLLTMLFLCVLPVSYAIVWVEPSWHCGPFSGYYRIYHLATKSLKNSLPKPVHRILDYIASPGIVIPLLVLMTLIIYYMVSLTGSLREANNDLKIQLRRERTEERRKMFKIAEKRQQSHDSAFTRWKKILPNLQVKSQDIPKYRGIVESIVALGQTEKMLSLIDPDGSPKTLQIPRDEESVVDENKNSKNEDPRDIIEYLELSESNVIPEIRISLTDVEPELDTHLEVPQINKHLTKAILNIEK